MYEEGTFKVITCSRDIKAQKIQILPCIVLIFLYNPKWSRYKPDLLRLRCCQVSRPECKAALSKYRLPVQWWCPRRYKPVAEIRNLMSAFPRARWWSERRTGCGPGGYSRWMLVQVQAQVGSSGSSDPCRYTVTQIHSTGSPLRGFEAWKDGRLRCLRCRPVTLSQRQKIILKT